MDLCGCPANVVPIKYPSLWAFKQDAGTLTAPDQL